MSEKRKILLIGNPNVGKSSVFGLLSSQYAEVSNYSGTTIELTSTRIGDLELIDTPGIYDLNSPEEESRVTREVLAETSPDDLILNVCNANSLDKDLFLTLQLLELGHPVICLLNQSDLIEENRVEIDIAGLAKRLGVLVLPFSAKTKKGLAELQELFQQKEYMLRSCGDLCKGDACHGQKREIIDAICSEYVRGTSQENQFTKTLNAILINPVSGFAIAALICWLILYQILGVWVAGDFVDLIENGFLNKYFNPTMQSIISRVLPIYQGDLIDVSQFWQDWSVALPMAIGTVLAGKYGILTLTVTYLIGLLLPLIWAFYFSWAVLEDCGYLPRLSVLTDVLFRRIGLNGRGIIPLVLGLGCVTMAMVTTRLMSSRREQLLMMILLSIAVPCSAQLGIINGLLAKIGGLQGWLIWLGIILGVMVVTGYIANKLLPGNPTPLMIDLPPLRLPSIENVLKKANLKSWFFLKESGVAFFWAAFVVAVCQVTGLLNIIIAFMQPLVSGLLHLPSEVALSFLMGMIRRDFGAFGLLDLDLNLIQVITASVSLTLFVPCIATLGVMVKERGWLTALALWSLSWVMGFGIGAIVTRVLEQII